MIEKKIEELFEANSIRGLTFMVNFGAYGGFYAKIYKVSARICLGWVAFTVIKRDVDFLLEDYFKIKELEK